MWKGEIHSINRQLNLIWLPFFRRYSITHRYAHKKFGGWSHCFLMLVVMLNDAQLKGDVDESVLHPIFCSSHGFCIDSVSDHIANDIIIRRHCLHMMGINDVLHLLPILNTRFVMIRLWLFAFAEKQNAIPLPVFVSIEHPRPLIIESGSDSGTEIS